MRSFSIQGPYGMHIALSTGIPGTLTITRATSEPPRPSQPNMVLTIPKDDIFIHDPTTAARRAPSPAPTEVEELDSEALAANLAAIGSKVRDFAYSPGPSTPATEIFDPYRGLAEFEHRLAQSPRRAPVSGKTSRRLLDLAWITQAEFERRADPMDREALEAFDALARARAGGKGKARETSGDDTPQTFGGPGYHPWRPLPYKSIPNSAEARMGLVAAHATYFGTLDRLRGRFERMQASEARERAAVEALRAQMEAGGVVRKRSLEDTPKRDCDEGEEGTAKRQRLCNPQVVSMPAPAKQYPAPLASYDPALYPDVAAIMESQGRADTPPFEDARREDTPPLEEAAEGGGVPLVRRAKGLKRTLSRTLTYKQL